MLTVTIVFTDILLINVGVKGKRRAEMLTSDFSVLPLVCLQALAVSAIVKH